MERVVNKGTLSSNKLKMQNFQYGFEPPQFTSMNQQKLVEHDVSKIHRINAKAHSLSFKKANFHLGTDRPTFFKEEIVGNWKSPTPQQESKKDLHDSPERKAKSSMGAHGERNFNIGHPSLQATN